MGEQVVDPAQYLLVAFAAAEIPEKAFDTMQQRKVPAAAGRARVPHVLGAVVMDFAARSATSRPSR